MILHLFQVTFNIFLLKVYYFFYKIKKKVPNKNNIVYFFGMIIE